MAAGFLNQSYQTVIATPSEWNLSNMILRSGSGTCFVDRGDVRHTYHGHGLPIPLNFPRRQGEEAESELQPVLELLNLAVFQE
jgi:hypothetical protein